MRGDRQVMRGGYVCEEDVSGYAIDNGGRVRRAKRWGPYKGREMLERRRADEARRGR